MSVPMEQAWARGLYGPRGFYRRELPADHFRTACHAAPDLLAAALLRLVRATGCSGVVDVGAGAGELLDAMAALPDSAGLDLTGVDLRDRPSALPPRVRWSQRPPTNPGPVLLLGWELLDVVPCPVLQADDAGVLRPVLVDSAGEPTPGAGLPTPEHSAWVDRWWPRPRGAARWPPGHLVEVGLTRDLFWHDLIQVVRPRVAVAVDYDHRTSARPDDGTLLGYRDGVACPPAFDGSCDLTAHVALDAVADAAPGTSTLWRQHEVLVRLGVRPALPPHELSRTDPMGYLRGLDVAGRARELLEPAGLGGFGWLITVLDDKVTLPLATCPAE